ncbi:MAG: TolC family protein [Gammaproteobacteria bacterium]|nr:TolC family protein [Gammaproteobacteria bacterium]
MNFDYFLKKIPIWFSTLLGYFLFVQSASSQSLVEMIEQAKNYDANYLASKTLFEANTAKAEQAHALLQPTVGLSLQTSHSYIDYIGSTSLTANASLANPFHRWSKANQASLNLVHPLYRRANELQFKQSQLQFQLAHKQWINAEQDLIARVSQAYLDVLTTSASIEFVDKQKASIQAQLDSAKRNFAIGNATITDTREAQARYDLSQAQLIALNNELSAKIVNLSLLVGLPNPSPIGWVLNQVTANNALTDSKLIGSLTDVDVALNGNNLVDWLNVAESQHLAITSAKLNYEIAQLEVQRAQAGHLPTVDILANLTQIQNSNGTSALPLNTTSKIASASINVNLPLYAGKSIQNKVDEAVKLEQKSFLDLEIARRQVQQAVKVTHLTYQSNLAQINALKTAINSSLLSLQATELGYQVGVRINLDVLNAQSQYFQTARDLIKAHYDLVNSSIKLHQASGILTTTEINRVSHVLTSHKP